MRKLTVNAFATLDGVMQAPGGPEEDPTGGFAHGGWSAGYWDEAMGAWMGEFMGKPFGTSIRCSPPPDDSLPRIVTGTRFDGLADRGRRPRARGW